MPGASRQIMSVTTAVKNSCSGLGEGPYWEEGSQSLLYVDMKAGDVHRWNSLTGKDEARHFGTGENVTLVIPTTNDDYLISLGRKLLGMDWESGKVTKEYCEVNKDLPHNRFNDGKCDPSGRLWAGTMDDRENGDSGCLFSLEKDGTVHKHLSGIHISNGLAWTADKNTLFYIDSIPRKVYAFDYDIERGNLTNQRTAITFTESVSTAGYPDGMTIDTDGKLWIACYAAGKVSCYDPETAQEIGSTALPAQFITSCCFGGPNYDELYVTSSRLRLTDEELAKQPLAGSIFKITGLGAKGRAATPFGGTKGNL